jgi:xanthine dehydrogenase molybdenum-binding subunit
MRPDAPRVHPRHPNVLSRTTIRRGDVEEALEASAHVVRGTWTTQRVEHLYLEPEAALAEPTPDGACASTRRARGSSTTAAR